MEHKKLCFGLNVTHEDDRRSGNSELYSEPHRRLLSSLDAVLFFLLCVLFLLLLFLLRIGWSCALAFMLWTCSHLRPYIYGPFTMPGPTGTDLDRNRFEEIGWYISVACGEMALWSRGM